MIPFLYLAGASVAMILLASNGSGYSESVKVSSQHAYPSRNHMQGMNVDNARTPIIWGNQVKELSASLLSDKTEFHQGEPILIYFQLKNIGKEAQIVSHAGFWANHKLVIEDAMRSELPLTTLGLEARAVFGNVTKRRKSFEGDISSRRGRRTIWAIRPPKIISKSVTPLNFMSVASIYIVLQKFGAMN